MIKQRNNHARSKKNKSKMRAKAAHMALMEQHLERKGRSTPGFLSKLIAKLHVSKEKEAESKDPFSYSPIIKTKLVGRLNQRQKRKLWRQAPYMRKRA